MSLKSLLSCGNIATTFPDVKVQGTISSTEDCLWHEQGQELHGGRGQVLGLHASPTWNRQRKRLRAVEDLCETGPSLQI